MTVNSMKTNEDKSIELEISVPGEVFEKAVEAAYKRNKNKINVPGFRRGKAPRKMIEKLYGEGVFYEEAVNNTYPQAFEEAVKEKELEIVGRPEIDLQDVAHGGYVFTAKVWVKPEVELTQYKGLPVEQTSAVVTDAEIDAELDNRRQQAGRLVTVENRAAQAGDTASIDFEGFVDGVAFEGGKGENYSLKIGSNTFIPGFEDQVIGKALGEEFDVNVTFPEEYHAEELKGKAAVFKCKLNELKETELPALDDELAKDISEFDTLDELKADIKDKLQQQAEEQSVTEVENKLMDLLNENLKVEVPVCMYEARIDEMCREFEFRLQGQGMNLATYLQYAGIPMEEFRKNYMPQAKQQVDTRLALEKIVELEQIVPTEEEIEAEYEKLAKSYNMKTEQVKQFLALKDLTANISMNKAIDLVRAEAKVTEAKADVKKPAKKASTKAEATKAEDGEEKPRRTRTKKVKEDVAAE